MGGGTGDFRGGGRGDDENDREEPGDDQDPRRPGDGGDIPVPVPPVPAPPNAPGPTPPGPNPPGPEDPTDPGETNDCLRLVDQLAYISPAGAESPLATGVMMMNLAKADPWRSKKHPSGFRDALTFDQGTDVFRHVVGHAGAVRGNAATGLVSVYELSIDLWQWAGGHQGAKAEVLGSLAGQASGISMVLSAGNPRVARRLIRPIICK